MTTRRVGRFTQTAQQEKEARQQNSETLPSNTPSTPISMQPATPKGTTRTQPDNGKLNQQMESINKMSTSNSNNTHVQSSFIPRSIGSVAHIDDIAKGYKKFEEMKLTPILVFQVDFTEGTYDGKPTKTAWMDTIDLTNGLPTRVVGSAYAVVRQMQKFMQDKSTFEPTEQDPEFYVVGKLQKVKFNDKNMRWEFVDIDPEEFTDDMGLLFINIKERIEAAALELLSTRTNVSASDVGDQPF